jgi:hypothetical protein
VSLRGCSTCAYIGVNETVVDAAEFRSGWRGALRHSGYIISQQKRKRVEEIFGWIKTIANFRRTRYRGRELTQLAAYLAVD